MAYEEREGSGALFVNGDKKLEKQPDYTGKVVVDGKARRIAGWRRISSKGTKFISVSISDFRVQNNAGPDSSFDTPAPEIPAQPAATDEFSDDLPW